MESASISALSEWHQRINGQFIEVNGRMTVRGYGIDPDQRTSEQRALRLGAGIVDLSCRGRLALIGDDRVKFLHGQVTNDVNGLAEGRGCYAAIVSAKGRMQCDPNIFRLTDELLLDFEPGYADSIKERLDSFVIADDVEVVDVGDSFGMFSVQGPRARNLLESLNLTFRPPEVPFQIETVQDAELGEIYVANRPRLKSSGYDLFAAADRMTALGDRLLKAAASHELAAPCGWEALETARIEAGIPRFGIDMDDRNFPQETGLEEQLVSYRKGCYIGQEIIARIRTYGRVNKQLRGFRLELEDESIPQPGTRLFVQGKESGYLCSVLRSDHLDAVVALGYARREMDEPGTRFEVGPEHGGRNEAVIVQTPFAMEKDV